MKKRIKIIGSGKYLPTRIVKGEELDRRMGLAPGSSERASGVAERRYAGADETNSFMGGRALMAALENAHLKFEDLDGIICASGTTEQAIPCTSALIQRSVGKLDSGIASFDVNATCLSFVTALDLASCLIETGRYRRLAIVSSEIASVGLNYDHLEASSLFGDGAAAFIFERTPEGEGSHLAHADMATFAIGSDTCRIEGGGTKFHPGKGYDSEIEKKFLFHMDGRKIFKLVLETIGDFTTKFVKDSGRALLDHALIIPHQASGSGLELVRRKLGIPHEKWMDILANHGNMIAASIPLALHTAIETKRIKRGDTVLLLGTSAGYSLGAVSFEY